jgi:hypothetical protein
MTFLDIRSLAVSIKNYEVVKNSTGEFFNHLRENQFLVTVAVPGYSYIPPVTV